MSTVTIRRIRKNVDMRGVHRMRKWIRHGKGEVLLAFNRRCTIARIVDANRDVYTFYANKGEQFSVEIIANRLADAGTIQLSLTGWAKSHKKAA
jgi:hypothetical protein